MWPFSWMKKRIAHPEHERCVDWRTMVSCGSVGRLEDYTFEFPTCVNTAEWCATFQTPKEEPASEQLGGFTDVNCPALAAAFATSKPDGEKK